jgi:ABC-2 type transport system ATP-binding protein
MAVIEVLGLRKVYRSRSRDPIHAVGQLDLEVPERGVFAFLGPNGAGKTTTLRCLLGLVHPTSGEIHILNNRVPNELHRVIGRIGSLLETPSFNPRFSARDSLLLLGQLAKVGASAVDDALDRVGLQERSRDHVATYSLGMRQRLGIAAALLKDPAVLLLDEPTNGLDPGGIADMRSLLRSLADEGRCVFVSSHLLSEMASIADHVSIIAKGKSRYSGPMADLLGRHDPGHLLVRIDNPSAAARVLVDSGFQVREEGEGDLLRIHAAAAEATRVGRHLASHDLFPLEIRPVAADLESIFFKLTADHSEAEE